MNMTTAASFADLKLPTPLMGAVTALKYGRPSAIQAQAIPVVLSHRDLMASAPSASDGGAAFCLPILAGLLKNPRKTALVLVASKDQAQAVDALFGTFAGAMPQLVERAVLIAGGAMGPQMKALQKRPRLIIAMPTRLVECLKRGALSLSSTEVLVLDEADQMLEASSLQALTEILRFLPKHRQTLLFAEDINDDVLKLSKKWQKEPVRVTIEAPAAAEVVETVARPRGARPRTRVVEAAVRPKMAAVAARAAVAVL